MNMNKMNPVKMADLKNIIKKGIGGSNKSSFFYMMKDCLVIYIIVQLFFRLVVFRAIVSSASMLPTLQIDEVYIVTSWTTFFQENKGLEYGDIVVFQNKAVENNLLVKRVIGLPGDTIKLENGILIRNGEIIKEDYISDSYNSFFYVGNFVVPEGEIFVLGDNRVNSNDSRFWETPTVPLSKVRGELRLWGK